MFLAVETLRLENHLLKVYSKERINCAENDLFFPAKAAEVPVPL